MSNNVDAIPPALARLRHMNNDVIQGRNALTPVLNRDDAMREWERRQSGQPPATHSYPQLEYLQQQAELVAGPWTHSRRYQAQPSSLSQSFQPPGAIVVDEPDRRDAALTSARTAARADPSTSVYATTAAAISSPPQAYPGGSMTTANRYAPSYAPQGATSGSFDTVDRRGDMNMYAPMQPDQYQSYGQSSPSHAQQHHAQSSNVPQSFYNSSIATTSAPQQQQRNPFQAQAQGAMTSNGQQRDPRWGPRGYGLAPEEL
jgi:dual specificity protein kinase YAK1